MTTTTTRPRTSAAPTQRRRTGAPYGAYVDGANALQIGYAEPWEEVDDRPVETPASVPRPEPDAEPVAAPLPVALPRASFVIVMAVVVIVAVLGVLVLNTRINENSFALDNLRSQQSALDLQEQQLSQQLTQLESTGNLSALAAQLGLVPAGTPAYITLPNGKVVGVPQPANGEAVGTGDATTTDPGR
jgi:hypothetical protein